MVEAALCSLRCLGLETRGVAAFCEDHRPPGSTLGPPHAAVSPGQQFQQLRPGPSAEPDRPQPRSGGCPAPRRQSPAGGAAGCQRLGARGRDGLQFPGERPLQHRPAGDAGPGPGELPLRAQAHPRDSTRGARSGARKRESTSSGRDSCTADRRRVAFAAGDVIEMGFTYKYRLSQLRDCLERHGFRVAESRTDETGRNAILLAAKRTTETAP